MPSDLGRLYRDEDGTTSVEYAFLLAVVVVAGLAAWSGLGSTLRAIVQQSTATVASGGTS